MRQPKMMIDLDDTLFNNNALEHVMYNNGLDIEDYDITFKLVDSNVPLDIQSEVWEKFQDEDFMCNLIPNPTVHDFLIDCYSRGYEMDIVTARSDKMADATNKMIKEHFPYQFNDVIFTNGESKLETILAKQYDVVIDDDSKDVMHMSNEVYGTEYQPQFFVPNNNHTPHNEADVPEILSGFDDITLITNLIDIEPFIFKTII